MEEKYLIVMELEQSKEEIQEYLEEGWHIEKDFGFMIQLGLYVDDYDSFIENLKNDLAYDWLNGAIDNYDTFEEFEKTWLKYLEEEKCLEYVNGYSYYIK